jgi:hypothetical protein
MNQVKINPLTPKVPTNQNDVAHHDPPLQSPLTPKMVNFPTNKGATLETPQFQHVYCMHTTQLIKFPPPQSNINVGRVGRKLQFHMMILQLDVALATYIFIRKKIVIQQKLVDVTKKSSKAFVDSLDFIQATNL